MDIDGSFGKDANIFVVLLHEVSTALPIGEAIDSIGLSAVPEKILEARKKLDL